MLWFGLMMAGAGTVDTITNTLLPITAKHFTSDLTLISVMVALNRICGFLVQPYAAWKSDRHCGPRGRRRPFLLGAWPVVLLSLTLLGSLPFIVPVEYHRTAIIVAAIFAVNVVMQAALDVCYGSGDPMYGDAFRSGDLGRANGIRMLITATAGMAMTFIFIPLADVHEFWPYAGAMLFVAVSYFVARFAVHERIPSAVPASGRYHPLKPLAELRDARTRTVALCGSSVLVALALTDMLHALFVTETLGLSMTTLGNSATAALIVSITMPYPVGWLVDRIGARAVLIAGLILLAGVETAFLFWVHDVGSLYVALIAFAACRVVVQLPMVPLLFHDTAPERRGSIFAAVQMTRAAAASVATIVAGKLAEIADDYRMCYFVAGIAALIGLVGALRLAPLRRNVPAPAMA
jgi:MFS family permease